METKGKHIRNICDGDSHDEKLVYTTFLKV